MLNKRNRLPQSKDFQEIYRKGYTIKGEFGMLKILNKDDNVVGNTKNNRQEATEISASKPTPPKFGIVVGKKVGNAVNRHKHTRRIRHIISEYLQKTKKETENDLGNSKITYISHKYAENFTDLKKELERQLDEAGKVVRGSTIKR